MLAAEGPHSDAKAAQWIGADAPAERSAGWTLLGQLAYREAPTPDARFEGWLERIERTIHTAPNGERDGMIRAIIHVGCRNEALRRRAIETARRIGPVEVDHGDTSCETPDVVGQIEKAWAHSTAKGFDSPAAHERTREPLRLRAARDDGRRLRGALRACRTSRSSPWSCWAASRRTRHARRRWRRRPAPR